MDNFISRWHQQVSKCRFKTSEVDERIMEQLIEGTRYPELQKELFVKDATLTLDKDLDTSQMHEASVTHMQQFIQTQQATNFVHTIGYHPKECRFCGRQPPPQPRHRCPTWGEACGKQNHWMAICLSRSRQEKGQQITCPVTKGHKSFNRKLIHTLGRYVELDNDCDTLSFTTIKIHSQTIDSW